MFIDDERMPPEGMKWVIARSFHDVKRIISQFGWPQFISFDHDLGDGEPSGKDIANWMVEKDIDSAVFGPNFKWTVHSQNPVGAKNISSLLSQYLETRFN
jgi:hypothetical protein